MKNKLKYQAAIAVFLLFSVNLLFAGENSKADYPKNKFEDRFSTASSSFDLRSDEPNGGSTGDDGIGFDEGRPNTNDALGPIGDANYWVLLFGLLYGIAVFKKNRQENICHSPSKGKNE
jgi:hypothetical protein